MLVCRLTDSKCSELKCISAVDKVKGSLKRVNYPKLYCLSHLLSFFLMNDFLHAKIYVVYLGVHVNHYINYLSEIRHLFENHIYVLTLVLLNKISHFNLQTAIHTRAICFKIHMLIFIECTLNSKTPLPCLSQFIISP